MNVLITGGCGNLGSRLVVPLVRRGDRVALFDVQRRPHARSPEFDQARFIGGDLANAGDVLEAVRSHAPDTVFHLGAILSAAAEEHPGLAWRVNMDGTRHVLEAAWQLGVRRVVFSSTVATYGPGLPVPLPADAPQWPASLYGATKVAGERLGVYYHHRFGLDFRGVRLPAIVAPRGAAGGASAFCSAAFEEAARLGAYSFYLRPTSRAPMLYIADAVQGLLDLHDAPEKHLTRRVYNIAGIGPSAEELAQAILQRLPNVRITYEPDPVRTAIVESWPWEIDDSCARRDWGWKAHYGLDRMADEILEVLARESQEP
ncbi:MAG: NAD-dependent epimerase/dehydratase family protein [Planctomycetes bacterium]|nr:NAD-dependent epimerase/dehydratase family protein [Planctomycetota bacterium]